MPPRFRKMRTVAGALGDRWVSDIQGGLSRVGIGEFLRLWDCVREIDLNDQEDRHIWKLEASGCYSSKSAYRAYFVGSVTFEPGRRLYIIYIWTIYIIMLLLLFENIFFVRLFVFSVSSAKPTEKYKCFPCVRARNLK